MNDVCAECGGTIHMTTAVPAYRGECDTCGASWEFDDRLRLVGRVGVL